MTLGNLDSFPGYDDEGQAAYVDLFSHRRTGTGEERRLGLCSCPIPPLL